MCAMQVAAASSSVCAVAALLMLLLFSPIAVARLTAITDGNINSAVSDWTTSPTTATTMYGDIGGWNVAAVTRMNNLFYQKEIIGFSRSCLACMGRFRGHGKENCENETVATRFDYHPTVA